ncbi:DoxX family protein [Nocardia fluminea]|uniref:DoxX family protein n=1 Tax=Nocardia fluminea TaxID=134984 RepID=UPI00343DF80C
MISRDLALALFADALVSVRPPRSIQRCLDGVGFPRDWWWTLIAIKLAATAGLLVGLKYPGVGFATAVSVVGYFMCAAYSQYRARLLGYEFWINCLGMPAPRPVRRTGSGGGLRGQRVLTMRRKSRGEWTYAGVGSRHGRFPRHAWVVRFN